VKTVVCHSAQDLRIENIELPAFGEPLSMRLHAIQRAGHVLGNQVLGPVAAQLTRC
jgi:hypothetical protein